MTAEILKKGTQNRQSKVKSDGTEKREREQSAKSGYSPDPRTSNTPSPIPLITSGGVQLKEVWRTILVYHHPLNTNKEAYLGKEQIAFHPLKPLTTSMDIFIRRTVLKTATWQEFYFAESCKYETDEINSLRHYYIMISKGKKSPARRVFKARKGMSQSDVLKEFKRGKTPNATINVCFVVPTILKTDIPARPTTPPSASNPSVYTVPDTLKQEKRDRSDRQSKLGAAITDNRKRVRILVLGNGDASDQ